MYIFRNAMKNLLRNKGRNILIFLILLITMTAVTTCAIVRQAAERQIDEYIQSFKPAVSMLTDYNRLAEDYPAKQITNIDGSTYWEAAEMPDYSPSQEQLEEWSKSEYVDHTQWWLSSDYCSKYNAFASETMFGNVDVSEYYGKDVEYFRQMAESDYEAKRTYYLSELFQASTLYKNLFENGHTVTADEAAELAARTIFGESHYEEYLDSGISDELADIALGIKLGYNDVMEGFIAQKEIPTGPIWAYSDFEFSESYFAQKILSLKEGKYPYALNECLVSNRFAEMNNLKIGDTIHITSAYHTEEVTMDLTISGLFSADYFDATAEDGSDGFVNQIFISAETMQQSKFTYYGTIDPTFYLKSTEDVSAFKKLLTDSGLSEYISLTDNSNELKELTQSVKKTSNFATALMMITLVLGGSIFLLLTFLAVGERKYEIGVLRSIGMKKNKVIRGFLYETAIIVLLCSMIGMAVGTVISQPIADVMLAQNGNEREADNSVGDTNIYFDEQIEGGDYSIEGIDGMGIYPYETEQSKNEAVSLQARLSWNAVMVILVASFILMVAAVLIAGLYITKFEPIKILSDQE